CGLLPGRARAPSMAHIPNPPGPDYTPQQRQPNRTPWTTSIIGREPGQAAARARMGIARCRRLRFHAGEGRIFAGGRLYRGEWQSGNGVCKRLLNDDFLIEGLPDPAYTHPAKVVRDMRKSSCGRFPDTQC